MFTFLWRKVQVETERYLSGVTRLYSFLLQHPPFLIPQPATTFSSSIAFSSSFTSSWSSIVPLSPLLWLSLLLNPSSILPVPTSLACRLHATCNEPDRPAGTQLPLAPCISESVSQSVSHWVSQSVSRIDTREEISFIVTMYILYSRHSRSLLLSPFLVVFFLVLSCEIYSHRGSFGRVECWPRASLFAARVQRMRRKMCTCRVHCVYDSLGRVSDRVRLTYFQEVRSMHHAAYA